ncbi:MAG: PadR family transcriptional regulator [Candidatus Kariarchaeaceae archaeon]
MTNTNNLQSKWVQIQADQLEGSALRFALLATIRKFQDAGGIYGYAISLSMAESTQGELEASNATFYAILRRLENEGLIQSQIGKSVSGPPRKHYLLTDAGEQSFQTLLQYWEYYYNIIKMLAGDDD